MNRMKRWVFCWLVLLSVCLSTICENPNRGSGKGQKNQSLGPDQKEGLDLDPNETSVHEGRQESNNEGNQSSEEEVKDSSDQGQRRGSSRDVSKSGPKQHVEENHMRRKHLCYDQIKISTRSRRAQRINKVDNDGIRDSCQKTNITSVKNPKGHSGPGKIQCSGPKKEAGSGAERNEGSETGGKQKTMQGQKTGQSSGQKKNQSEERQPLLRHGSKHQGTNGDVNLSKRLRNSCARGKGKDADATCLKEVSSILGNGNHHQKMEAIESLQQVLEELEVNESRSMSFKNMVVYLHKQKGPFTGLEIYATENKVTSNKSVPDSKVNIQLPGEIKVGANNTIVFSMLTFAAENETTDELYENRLVGLSVRGMNISGLQDRVNITMMLTSSFNGTQKPCCVFLDISTRMYSKAGCITVQENDQITCSCDHLTFFGVLLVSADLPEEHREILSYITLIGCSLSLFVLIITIFLFITNRKVRSDIGMKVHINLAIALTLLNGHFLPSQAVAAMSYPGLCLYIAVALHFSLLSTFSWMALEGFHLYLLLVRVFNIYVRKYLLKLSVVGWGVPAVIVSVVVAIDRDIYGVYPLDSTNENSTEVCYIIDDTVKIVTTVGVFGLVFLFNVIMLGVTIRRVVKLRKSRQSGQINHGRVKGDICTVLGVTILLGIPWGLIFFSFGYLTVPSLYVFCILNSLQGFFIFLWFLMSLRKLGQRADAASSKTQSTNS